MDHLRGVGRAIFAGVFLMIAGTINVIYGIAGISRSHVFVANSHYVFGELRTWGWVTLIIGVLEILASVSLFGGGAYGRWFGVVAASLAAIAALLEIPQYPLLSIAVFALSLWIIHGLVIYGHDQREIEAYATGAGAQAPRERTTTRT